MESDETYRGAGVRLRQDARTESLPGCRDSSRSGPGGKPGRSRTRSGLVKGEAPCGLRATPHRVADEMPCLVKGGAP